MALIWFGDLRINGCADNVFALNISGTAEADRHLSGFDDDGDLAAAMGKFQHPGKRLFVFEHVQVLEGDLAPSEGLPGPGGVGSEILPENDDFFIHFAWRCARRTTIS